MSCLCVISSVQLDPNNWIYLPHVSSALWNVLKLIVDPVTLSDVFGVTDN